METQTQKAERKHPDKKPRVLHFTTRLSTCQPKIYNIDRRARRQDATRTKQCDQDSITIPRFISHCRLQGSRIGQSEPGPKLPAAPPWIYKGDRDPISRPSLSSLSLSLLEVGARVCQSSCRATSTRTSSGPLPMEPLSATCERSRLSHWYSNPISPSLSAFVCRGSRRTECSILRPGLRDVDKLVGRRENISQGFSFSFFPFEGKGRERGKVENDFRQL